MTAETDKEYLDWLRPRVGAASPHDLDRLFALARRGAAMEKLEVTKTRIRRGKDGIDYIETFFVFTEPLPPPPKGAEE